MLIQPQYKNDFVQAMRHYVSWLVYFDSVHAHGLRTVTHVKYP